MKKIIALAISLLLLFSLCACKGATPQDTPSLAEGEQVINNLIITLPEGFALREVGGIKVAICPEYPDKTDNISFATTQKDSPDEYTKDSLDGIFGSLMTGFAGGISLENSEIEGCPVLIYSYNLMLNEKPLTAVQYMVFGEEFTDVITVTLSSADSLPAIEQAIKSARIK